jgi:hypothetical protein
MSIIEQPQTKSKALSTLEALRLKHWQRLNVCHFCKRKTGKHKKMKASTFKEEEYSINLMNCQHSLKICNICYKAGHCIIKVKYSKLEKKRLKKEKVKALK